MSVSRQKRDWKIPAAVAVAVVLIGGMVVSFLWMFHLQGQYKNFLSDLSDSTVLAHRFKSLEIVSGGERTACGGQDAEYKIYRMIVDAGQGKPRKELPERAADVELLYGDGTKLQAWGVKVENSRRNTDDGVLFCYTGRAGERYIYDTDMLSIGRVLAACGS